LDYKNGVSRLKSANTILCSPFCIVDTPLKKIAFLRAPIPNRRSLPLDDLTEAGYSTTHFHHFVMQAKLACLWIPAFAGMTGERQRWQAWGTPKKIKTV
jgi:hypothetical protein